MLLFLVVVLSCVSRTLARALISDVLIFGSRKETLTIRSFSLLRPRYPEALGVLVGDIKKCEPEDGRSRIDRAFINVPMAEA